MAKIFLSYSRSSADDAAAIRDDLALLGHTVWFDKDITGGARWWQTILRQIRDCDVFSVVLDPHWAASDPCRLEFEYALATNAPVVPVLSSNDVQISLLPEAMQHLNFVNYQGSEDRQSLADLAKALSNAPDRGALPDPLPKDPMAPISELAKLAGRIRSDEPLSGEDQKSLLFDVETAFKNPEQKKDARALLVALSKRPDVLAVVANEISETLATPKKPLSTAKPKRANPPKKPKAETSAAPEVKQPPKATAVPDFAKVPKEATVSGSGLFDFFWENLRRGAGVGVVVGAIVSYGSLTISSAFDWPSFAILLAIYAVAIIVSSVAIDDSGGLAFIAILCAGAGFVIATLFYGPNSDPWMAGVVFGVPAGLCVGAIAGRIIAEVLDL